jgi:S1-C subfamily serine protease
MAKKSQASNLKEESTEHIVSTRSRSARDQGKTVTLTVPTFPRPKLRIPSNKQVQIGLVTGAFVIVSLLSGVLGGWLETRHIAEAGLTNTSLSGQEKIVTSDSDLITEIAKTMGPSVVSINVDISSTSSDSQDDGGFGLFGFSQPEDEEAAGTGIIISSGGYIMTNRHVVPDGTTSVSVTLSNGTELKDVSVVGRTSPDDSLDLAFLKINNTEGQKLIPAAIGDSSDVQVGDSVVAIGNALGQFQNTVTSGIISGYGRSVEASDDGSSDDGLGTTSDSTTENLDDLFQTDAAINEGNSGGPLVNLNGQVIGINTAIAGDAQNIGFAIPINDAKGLMNQVLETGKFSMPYLGVRYIPLTADVADEYNLSVQNGAFIAPSSDPTQPSVVSGSPAATAGLQTNDIITQVNGTDVDQTHSLTSLLDQELPGDSVTLTIIRGNQTLHVNVILGAAPSD